MQRSHRYMVLGVQWGGMAERSVTMNRETIDEFLGSGGTGVLSLAKDDTPYALPVSYGYDAATQEFYLRLSMHPDSRKQRFLDDSTECQLVVYDQVDKDWCSVIATGKLTEVEETEITPQVVEGIRRAELPLIEIIDEPQETVEFRIFRLSVFELTGRTTNGA